MPFEFDYEWNRWQFKVWDTDGYGGARCLQCGKELPQATHTYNSLGVIDAAEAVCRAHVFDCAGRTLRA